MGLLDPPNPTFISAGEPAAGMVSPAGRLAENTVGPDGLTPLWVLQRQRTRLCTGVDIYIIAGQSNAAAQDVPAVNPYDNGDDVAIYHNAYTYQVGTPSVLHPILTSSMAPGDEFAREMARRQPHRIIVMVQTGVGSTGFTTTSLVSPPSGYNFISGGTWDRTLTSDTNNLYLRTILFAQTAFQTAQAAQFSQGLPIRFAGLIWAQGEADRGFLTQSQYATKLDDLIAQMRTDLQVPNLPVIVGSMTPEIVADAPYGLPIQLALIDTPRRNQYCRFVYGPQDSVKFGERIHYSAQANTAHATMFIDALRWAPMNVNTNSPQVPQQLTLTRVGDTVKATWAFPNSRVTAFSLRYSINGGSTWTTVAPDDGVLGTVATFTQSAALIAEVNSTNEVGTSDWSIAVPVGSSTSEVDLPFDLAAGEAVMDRMFANSVVSLSTGIMRLAFFTARKTEAITKVRTTATTGVTGQTLCRIGIYTVDANDNLVALVASTANDTTLWNTSGTAYTKSLSSTFNKVRGTRYAIAALSVGGSTPSLLGNSTLNGAEAGIVPRRNAALTGQTDLPSGGPPAVAVGSFAANGASMFYAALVP